MVEASNRLPQDVIDVLIPGPAIISLLRELVASNHRIEGQLGELIRRDRAQLNALDEAIRAADADLITAAGDQTGGVRTTQRRAPMTGPTPPDVTVDQVVTDFGKFRDDVKTTVQALQDALASVTIPPAAQQALNDLDTAIQSADSALPTAATPPPSV